MKKSRCFDSVVIRALDLLCKLPQIPSDNRELDSSPKKSLKLCHSYISEHEFRFYSGGLEVFFVPRR